MSQERLRRSRRRFLTSIGATAAMLPLLRGLPSYAQSAGPTKLILMFSPNGRIRHLWGADDATGSLVMRQNLAPLQPFAEHIQVTEGVRNYVANLIGGTHEGGMMSLFTGSGEGGQMGGGTKHPSIDTMFMAQATGTARMDSLYQQIVGELNGARSASSDNRAIYDASGAPRDPLHSPWEVMEQYLSGAVSDMMGPTPEQLAKDNARKNMFDALNGQLSTLMPRLCSEDQYQLQGMQDALAKAAQTVDKVVCSLPTLPAKPNIDPNSGNPIWMPPETTIDFNKSDHWYRQRSRQQIDLLVAALACGVTRSGVLQYDQAASVAKAVGQSQDHHNTSHMQPQLNEFLERMNGMPPDYKQICVDHEEDPESWNSIADHNQAAWDELSVWETYYAEEFAYLLGQLQSHGVLDDTLVLWGSEIDAGAAHSHFNMPFLLAAGPNIPIKRGSVVRFPLSYDNDDGCIPSTGASPSHNDMLRTVLKAVGVDAASVGTAMGKDLNGDKAIATNVRILDEMLTTAV